MLVRTCLVVTAVCVLAPCFTYADEAADAFNQVFGEEYKRATTTPSPADDVALAKQLLDAAKAADRQPPLLALLYEKAYELGIKDPSGYAAALAAMQLLADKIPEKKADCLAKCAAVRQRDYAAARGESKTLAGEALIQALCAAADAQAAAGDTEAAAASLRQAITTATAVKSESKAALQTQLAAVQAQQQAEEQATALRAKLAADPKDAAARKELVRLCLVELDNPAEAAKFVDEGLEETARKFVPAAAKNMNDTPELACSELAKWYQDLADQAAGTPAKTAMLSRAKAYYERFLALHAAEDIARTAVALSLKKVNDALAKLAPKEPAGPGRWVECLSLIDLAEHTKGNWVQRDGRLAIEKSSVHQGFTLPVSPKGDFEVTATFTNSDPTGILCVHLPLGTTSCALLFGLDGKQAGLDFINGKGYFSNESTTSFPRPPAGREHLLAIKVVIAEERVEVASTLDGQPLLRWKGPLSALKCFYASPRRSAIFTWNSNFAFRSVRFRSLTGETKVGLPPKPKAEP
jgi:hypothetical protein